MRSPRCAARCSPHYAPTPRRFRMLDPAPVIDGVSLAAPEPGHNLPPSVFTSASLFELEQRAIFATSWVHVADASELAEPGAYVAATIGRTPVVIVRDRAK